MVKTAVLFITFARPEFARQTFDAIKKAKPQKLYFYSNRAREDRPDEVAKNNEIRAYVDEINWDCNLKTFFRDEYVDIYTSLWGAFDWVFDNEEQAILLEEDRVPSLAFFDFCEQLLPKFKDNQRVWYISGTNYFESSKKINPGKYDYFFSSFASVTGWATWRDRWRQIQRDGVCIKAVKDLKIFEQVFCSEKWAKREYKRWSKRTINGIYMHNAWDIMLQISLRINNGVGIVPIKNLASNIGIYGAHVTVKNKYTMELKASNDDKYIIKNHPPYVFSDIEYTTKFLKVMNKKKNLIIRGINYLLKKLNKNAQKSR